MGAAEISAPRLAAPTTNAVGRIAIIGGEAPVPGGAPGPGGGATWSPRWVESTSVVVAFTACESPPAGIRFFGPADLLQTEAFASFRARCSSTTRRSRGNCYKVRLLFAHLGIEYERRELDVIDRSNRREVLGELNPALRVPTLVLDDGRALGRVQRDHLLLRRGHRVPARDPFERAQVLQWLFFEQYSHEPNIAVARFWADRPGSTPAARPSSRPSVRGGAAALEAMERHLTDRPFLVGDRYTIADIALYAYTHVAPEGGFELEPYPAIRAWLAARRDPAGPRADHGVARTTWTSRRRSAAAARTRRSRPSRSRASCSTSCSSSRAGRPTTT